MDLIQVIGIVAGILTSVSLVPQLIKIIRKKKANDVALFMPIILLCGQILWIVYGVMKKDIPIIATNVFSVLVNITVLILRIIYGKKT
jgi:MtN3 and saliva related transmembrane protein